MFTMDAIEFSYRDEEGLPTTEYYRDDTQPQQQDSHDDDLTTTKKSRMQALTEPR